jgi:hypothetical protein
LQSPHPDRTRGTRAAAVDQAETRQHISLESGFSQRVADAVFDILETAGKLRRECGIAFSIVSDDDGGVTTLQCDHNHSTLTDECPAVAASNVV